jgi:hypothetical protein
MRHFNTYTALRSGSEATRSHHPVRPSIELAPESISKVQFHVSGRGDEGLETLIIARSELADLLSPGFKGTLDDYFAAAMAKYGPASDRGYDLLGRFLFEVVPYAETEDGIVEHGAFLVGKPWGDQLPLVRPGTAGTGTAAPSHRGAGPTRMRH